MYKVHRFVVHNIFICKKNAHILHTPEGLITLLEIEQNLVQISWMKPECIGLYFY